MFSMDTGLKTTRIWSCSLQSSEAWIP